MNYQCTDCGAAYSTNKIMYLCPVCEQKNSPEMPPKGVLKLVYDYKSIAATYSFRQLKELDFLPLLPINSLESLPPLRVGKTPLYKYQITDNQEVKSNLFFKDDSLNPTFSFKDRASALVSAFAKERGISTIVAASTGNAGSSLAGICASQKQQAIIFVPESAPKAKLSQIVMYGAQIVPVAGTYDDAFDLSLQATRKMGWYNRNTAYNPLTIEGKKTVSFEIFAQMGEKIPDRIFVPVGDGVIISAVYKGFEDLLRLKLIEKMPIVVAVQAVGSANIFNNLHTENFISQKSQTVADSISVDIPRNFYMAKAFFQQYKGEAITVSDKAILLASKQLSTDYGLFSEPASAAAFAGFLAYLRENKLSEDNNNLVLLTGSGLKDVQSIQPLIEIPAGISNLDDLI